MTIKKLPIKDWRTVEAIAAIIPALNEVIDYINAGDEPICDWCVRHDCNENCACTCHKTTEKIPLHDDQAWRKQLEITNARLLENNRILSEKLNGIESKIPFLRMWLNERPQNAPCLTNEDLGYWLGLNTAEEAQEARKREDEKVKGVRMLICEDENV